MASAFFSLSSISSRDGAASELYCSSFFLIAGSCDGEPLGFTSISKAIGLADIFSFCGVEIFGLQNNY